MYKIIELKMERNKFLERLQAKKHSYHQKPVNKGRQEPRLITPRRYFKEM